MLVKNKEYIVKVAKAMVKKGIAFVELVVADNDSEEQVTVWGADKTLVKVGDIVKFKEVKMSDGRQTCSISKLDVTDGSESPLKSLLPKPPTKTEWDTLKVAILALIDGNDLKSAFSDAMDRLYLPYSTHTAARSNHHVFAGGLAQHTYEILNMFNAIYPSLPFKVNPFIVAMACLFHDYGKLSEYTEDFEVTPAMSLQGHPFLGAEAIGQYLRLYNIEGKMIQHCQHCVLAHHGKLEYGSPVVPATAEAFLVAQLDGLSGHGVMFNVPDGTRTLGTTIYHY